jgi:predicted double-glycine peptidase
VSKYLRFLAFALVAGCSIIKEPDYEYGDMSNWQAVRFGGVVKQQLDFSCGLTSLATIFQYHFGDESLTEKDLLERFIVTLSEKELARVYAEGASIAQLAELAKSYGYKVRLLQPSFEELKVLSEVLPIVVYLETTEFRHFAVLRGISEYQVLLADSSRGNVNLSLKDFEIEWRKHGALILAKEVPDIKNKLLYQPNPAAGQAGAELARSVILRK